MGNIRKTKTTTTPNDSIVAKYLNKFYNITSEAKGQIIFRGQANSSWRIKSSAARRLSDQIQEGRLKENRNSQSDFISYHENLISNAHSYGYAEIKPESKLSDLEILAEIQHLGGATCLVDFSTNFLIALWMASGKESKKEPKLAKGKLIKDNKGNTEYNYTPINGKIFWIDLGEDTNMQNIVYYNQVKEKDNIRDILTKVNWNFELPHHKLEPCFWLWNPTRLNERIIMQNSVFLFGLAAFPDIAQNLPAENLQYKKENVRIAFNEIEVLANDKEKIRNELENLFGVSAETIYYDLQGYAYEANNYSKPISRKIISNSNCLLTAKENIKKENYPQAIINLSQAISCKSRKINGDCLKGSCLCENNNLGILYFWKGIALNGKKQFDEALLNFQLSINVLKKPPFNESNYSILCEAYRKASIILYQKKDYIATENIMLQLYSTFSKHSSELTENSPNYQNGADAIMTLYELMLIQLKENDFILIDDQKLRIREIAGKLVENVIDNSIILRTFLESMYNFIYAHEKNDILEADLDQVFNQINDQLDKIFKVIDANKGKENKSICMINYFYWEYNDFIKWIESVRDCSAKSKNDKEIFITKNANQLILLAQKASDAQNEISNKIFEESRTAAD